MRQTTPFLAPNRWSASAIPSLSPSADSRLAARTTAHSDAFSGAGRTCATSADAARAAAESSAFLFGCQVSGVSTWAARADSADSAAHFLGEAAAIFAGCAAGFAEQLTTTGFSEQLFIVSQISC